jgi:hypothetical protein
VKFKDFIANNIEQPEICEDSQVVNYFEESKQNHIQPHDPPAVMIMRRKQIRQFPGGQRVALYFVPKLNKYITVPYSALQWSATVEEQVEEIQEDIVKHLQNVVTGNTSKSYKFKDNKTLKIDRQTAHAVLMVHNALNDENKRKLADMANKSKSHFSNVVDFAWKNVK